MYKIIGADQNEYGPITRDQLRQWIADRRVNAQTRIQTEDNPSWRTLGEIPELASLLGEAVPPVIRATPPPLPPRTAGKRNGLLIALVAIAIVGTLIVSAGIVAALVLPALAKGRDRAQRISCMNNMRQLAVALHAYADQHSQQFPPSATWCDAIREMTGGEQIFRCPAGTVGRCGYAFNARLGGMDPGKIDSGVVMLFECEDGWNQNGGPELLISRPRHARTVNVVFVDGSVQSLTEAQVATVRWDP